MNKQCIADLNQLGSTLNGDLYLDRTQRLVYATDASIYQELPLGVARPKDAADIKALLAFANKHKIGLIPRTGGTSLAGQCVGDGLVVDVSRYMNQILEINKDEGWARVQPGVVRDDLNKYLAKQGLYFGPETSTSNRAMIGGMVGNNSCGTRSLIYKTTRENVYSIHAILSDGSEVEFKSLDENAFKSKCAQDDLEGSIYRHLQETLPAYREQVEAEFPKKQIIRRNTGYAIDGLLNMVPFADNGRDFDMCHLLCGSEGTLAFTTEVKIKCEPLPPKEKVVVLSHFDTMKETLSATLKALEYKPRAVELFDDIILELSKENIEQRANLAMIDGSPEGLLAIEFATEHMDDTRAMAEDLIQGMNTAGLGFSHKIIEGKDVNRVWDLRKAGLGVLSNIVGDTKAVACVEDTAVAVEDLPDYIEDFRKINEAFNVTCCHYAHADTGEIHLRPMFNLKDPADVQRFCDYTRQAAQLVKRYRGSLSGEHGDGRVRAPYIADMYGKAIYDYLGEIKGTWDPNRILNPGKIVDPKPIDANLRTVVGKPTPDHKTLFDFSDQQGLLRFSEKCNGTGTCRKTHLSGGTMCPSYMASLDESNTTRARATTLRQVLTENKGPYPFDSPELKEVMDLCLSCKGCKRECPSSVDIATMKAEVLYQQNKVNGASLRSRMMANIDAVNRWASLVPGLYNFMVRNPLTGGLLKSVAGIAQQRDLPTLSKQRLRSWVDQNPHALKAKGEIIGEVILFIDEFTDVYDSHIGRAAIRLLTRLGYTVRCPRHQASGRSYISKGFLEEAKYLVRENVKALSDHVTDKRPMIGLEPSAVLTFRDEALRLVGKDQRQAAESLAENTFLIEEFLAREAQAGRITSGQFKSDPKTIKLHGHCHQKALSELSDAVSALSIPEGCVVTTIPSGCCGMAGSFGYEEEHADLSMKVGELVLFPAVREANQDTVIAAAGTSCRHQIADGTQRKAQHPVEILAEMLKP